MKFLIQRVSHASVHIVDTDEKRSIEAWYVVYVGISVKDTQEAWQEKVETFVKRIIKYPLWSTTDKKKTLSLSDIKWEILMISNFTLYGRNKKSAKIDFTHAAAFDEAKIIYDYIVTLLHENNIPHKTWIFWALMEIESKIVWPVNVVLEY